MLINCCLFLKISTVKQSIIDCRVQLNQISQTLVRLIWSQRSNVDFIPRKTLLGLNSCVTHSYFYTTKWASFPFVYVARCSYTVSSTFWVNYKKSETEDLLTWPFINRFEALLCASKLISCHRVSYFIMLSRLAVTCVLILSWRQTLRHFCEAVDYKLRCAVCMIWPEYHWTGSIKWCDTDG